MPGEASWRAAVETMVSVALPGHARAGRGRGARVDAVACEAGARGQPRSVRGAVAADDLGKEKMRAEKKEKERGGQTRTAINWRATRGRRRL